MQAVTFLTATLLPLKLDSMQVRVLYFGVLKDVLSSSGEVVALPEGAKVADLVEQLRNGNGIGHRAESAGHPVWSALAVAVNREYAMASAPLHDGDEVALLPPVSGGVDSPAAPPAVALVRQAIDRDALVASLQQPGDGAVVVFDGVVRDNTRGRKTLYLDYEAYEEMALAQMQKLAEEAAERFAIDRVGMMHRLGRLEIGESSIVIVVTSAHRAAAFDACRWLIDTLKRTVPVWKKEHFADGAVWTDGEPFPAELQPGPSA
ncbi:MAG TPA: molybdenum cofactor biosynthesis protein MoaE [Acidobacteriaceae bacterium]|nr:molybdenum cofactor biosynthesis protein MoaE [Acidobacteriaceae bacterium]